MARQATTTRKSTKSTRIATPRRSTRTTKSQEHASVVPAITKTAQAFRFKKSYIILALSILAIATLLFLFRGLIVAATVNGEPVSRVSVVRELEKRGGKQVVDQLIAQALVRQEARKRNISVSQDEVNKEIKQIEERLKQQGQTLDQAIKAEGISRSELEEQIRTEKMLDKMVGNVTVTDKEVSDYIEQNKQSIPENAKQADIKAGIRDQKRQDKKQALVQDLQKKAKINYFVQY